MPANPATPRSEARKLYDTLHDVDFLDQLKVEELDELLTAMRKRRYAKGETVFKQGAPGDALYLVGGGQLSMTVRKGLRSSQVRELREGEYFGESALLDESPRAASVTALSACELYILHKQDFEKILLRNPGIVAGLRAHRAKTRQLREKA